MQTELVTPEKPDISLTVSSSFLPLFVNKYRYLIPYGGAGSSKSETMARKVLRRCWHEGSHRVLIVRKTRKSLKESTWKVMLTLFEDYQIEYHPNKSDLYIRFRSKYGAWNTLLFCGLDDVQKLKSIKGVTMIWCEETTEISKDDFVQLDLRLRDPTPYYKQFMMTFNPDETQALWLKELFFGELPDMYTGPGKKANSYLHHSTFEDNPIRSVREEYKAVLDDLGDETYTKIYKHGIWAAAKGRIFFWPEEPLPAEGVVDEGWFDEIIYGVDFGFTVSHAAYVKIWRKGLKFWVKELIYERGLTNPNLIPKIKDHPEADVEADTYCDSAEPKSIQEMEDAGINAIKSEKGPDSVRFGYDLLSSLDICIVKDTSPNLIAETRDHKWKEDRFGNPTGEPVKFKDHLISAARYAIYTYYLKYLRAGQTAGKVSYRGMPAPKKAQDEAGQPVEPIQEKPGRERPFAPDEEIIQDKKILAEEETKGGRHDRRKGKIYTPW